MADKSVRCGSLFKNIIGDAVDHDHLGKPGGAAWTEIILDDDALALWARIALGQRVRIVARVTDRKATAGCQLFRGHPWG